MLIISVEMRGSPLDHCSPLELLCVFLYFSLIFKFFLIFICVNVCLCVFFLSLVKVGEPNKIVNDDC